MAKKKRQDVVFRRVRGRIVPIKVSDRQKTAASAGATVAGAAVAAEGARTTRVYQNKKTGITIDRKKFTVQPFATDRLGNTLIMNKKGERVGRASFYRTLDKKGDFAFSWLSVKRNHRGKGYSNLLTKESARVAKGMGGKSFTNQVVHKGSLLSNWDRKRDKLFRETKYSKKELGKMTRLERFIKGKYKETKITKAQGLKNIKNWREKGVMTSNVFRRTEISSLGKSRLKPYYTGKSKALMVGGAALAAGGLSGLLKKRKKNGKK